LTALAEGVVVSSDIVAEEAEGRADAAREATGAWCVEQGYPAEGGQCPGGLDHYRDLMQAWEDAVLALEAVSGALHVGQDALDAWVHSGELPQTWGPFCADIGDGVNHLLALLEDVGVDVPAALTQAAPYASSICTVAGEYFSPTEG
jgi:hypothetical protein